MPKRIPIGAPTPMSVYAATRVFGSELRVHLIHYYGAHPGRQADAARSLNLERALVSINTRALVETGVVVAGPDRTYSVDAARFHELLQALEDFGPPAG